MPTDFMTPAEIEQQSFAIITEELRGRSFPPGIDEVVKRVIHASADFSYADSLCFSAGVIDRAKAALAAGATVVTDTNMVLAGINKTALAQVGGRAVCFIADEDVAQEARERGITRAAVSMERAAALTASSGEPAVALTAPSGERAAALTASSGKRTAALTAPSGEPAVVPILFAIGNAPTALLRLHQLIQAGRLQPALVIGVPVGFVHVVESKELFLGGDTPYIIARGRKGGSNIAAAIVNALLYQVHPREGVES